MRAVSASGKEASLGANQNQQNLYLSKQGAYNPCMLYIAMLN